MTIYCETCTHSGLCKYEEAYHKKVEAIKNYISQEDDMPHFSAELTCSKFSHVDFTTLPHIPHLRDINQPIIQPYQPHPYDINSPVYQPIITCSTKEKE